MIVVIGSQLEEFEKPNRLDIEPRIRKTRVLILQPFPNLFEQQVKKPDPGNVAEEISGFQLVRYQMPMIISWSLTLSVGVTKIASVSQALQNVAEEQWPRGKSWLREPSGKDE